MEGPFVYYGKVERLKEEVETNKDKINQRYREILGEKRYSLLTEMVRRTLTPESYLDSIADFESIFGVAIPENSSSKMVVAKLGDLKFDSRGNIMDRNVELAAAFYVSEKSFKNSGSFNYTNRIIASYVHEFDHYVNLCLPRVPLYLADFYLSQCAGRQVKSIDQLADFLVSLEKDARPDHMKRRMIASAVNSYTLCECFEQGNQVLDKQVLDSVGIKVPLLWRKKPKQFVPLPIPYVRMTLSFPIVGDRYLGLNEKEIIDRSLEWEDYFTIHSLGSDFLTTLWNSFKEVKTEILPISVLIQKEKEMNEK